MYRKEFVEKEAAIRQKLDEVQQEHLLLMAEKVEEDPVEPPPAQEATAGSSTSPFQFGS